LAASLGDDEKTSEAELNAIWFFFFFFFFFFMYAF
jgi:hypothetical protein